MKTLTKEDEKKFSFDDWLFDHFPKPIYRFYSTIKDIKYGIKYFFQRTFRKHHTSDLDLWNLGFHFAEIIYPKLKAFIDMNKSGYPAIFSNWDESMGITKEEYKNNFIGGEEKEWNKTLNEMLFAFEYTLHHENNKKIKNFYKKWNLKDPREKTPENKVKHVWYENKETGESILTDEPEKLGPEWTKDEEYEFYYNVELEKEYSERAQKGFELFGKYFLNLWD